MKTPRRPRRGRIAMVAGAAIALLIGLVGQAQLASAAHPEATLAGQQLRDRRRREPQVVDDPAPVDRLGRDLAHPDGPELAGDRQGHRPGRRLLQGRCQGGHPRVRAR